MAAKRALKEEDAPDSCIPSSLSSDRNDVTVLPPGPLPLNDRVDNVANMELLPERGVGLRGSSWQGAATLTCGSLRGWSIQACDLDVPSACDRNGGFSSDNDGSTFLTSSLNLGGSGVGVRGGVGDSSGFTAALSSSPDSFSMSFPVDAAFVDASAGAGGGSFAGLGGCNGHCGCNVSMELPNCAIPDGMEGGAGIRCIWPGKGGGGRGGGGTTS
mmetsp:Transcript_122706/g.191533  ORF Transcript_122706/g.191533 Transcript_122706/m.191533 type:complete len:215 (-) Transcript_122706:2182-2826(-)